MKKSDINLPPMYFDRYIDLYEDVDLETAFQQSIDELASFDWEKCRRIGLSVYAPGKWTIADILQHLIDWERINDRLVAHLREAMARSARLRRGESLFRFVPD